MQATQSALDAHTLLAISVTPGHVMVIRQNDGSSQIFKGSPFEFVIAPILQYEGRVIIENVGVNYQCGIIPRAVPGMAAKRFPREMSPKIKNFFSAAIQEQAASLIEKQADEGGLTLEVEYDEAHFTAFVKFVA